MGIIISIKPCFSEQIYLGNKVIELRKRLSASFTRGAELYIYTSSPVKAITGVAIIDEVENLPVQKIKKQYLSAACISSKAFDDYYNGHDHGSIIKLKKIIRFTDEISLSTLREKGFTAPQSFCYLTDAVRSLIK